MSDRPGYKPPRRAIGADHGTPHERLRAPKPIHWAPKKPMPRPHDDLSPGMSPAPDPAPDPAPGMGPSAPMPPEAQPTGQGPDTDLEDD